MSLLFVSVVRQGLSRALPVADAGAASAALAGWTLAEALTVQASATLGATKAADVPLRVLGPGDVVGIDPGLVLRTDPPAGAQRVDTSLFPLIEFDLPGLPWTFTPLAAAGGRLRPWIALVVVPYEIDASPLDLEPLRRGRLPVLTVERAEDLPPMDEAWAWAHAQLAVGDAGAAASPADLERFVAEHPEGCLSRLLCARRLEADYRYVACVVPTFEATRTAGLGQDPDGTLAPAWGPTTAFPLRLPVLHHWEFFTAETGNFEQAVRRLRGTDPPAESGRVVDAADPGPAVVRDPAAAALPLAGALRPETLRVAPYAGPAVAGYEQLARIGQVVTSPGGRQYPVVDVPLYAGRHVGVATTTGAPVWVRNLNTDPRHRAAAALGARIVRDNQEALMRSAWKQAGDVEEANRRLRRARLGRAASERIVARHIEPLTGVARLRVLAPGFARLGLPRTDRTLAGLVAGSRVPDLVLGPAFTSLTRPGGRIGRHLAPAPGVVADVVTGINNGSVRPDRGELGRPGGLVTLEAVLGVVDAARDSVRGGGESTPVAIGGLQPTAPGTLRLHTAATAGGRGRATTIRISDRAGVVTGGSGTTTTLRGDFALPAATVTRRLAPADLTAERVRAMPGRVRSAVGTMTIDLTDVHRERLAELFEPVVRTAPVGGDAGPKALDVARIAGEALVAIDPATTIARAVLGQLTLPAAPAGADPLDDVLAAPRFPAPLAPELIRIAPDLVLPGLDEIAPDRVFAVVSNAPFVHAVLAGANHELMRELRWRGYPTDERGTGFHRFWREDDDEIADLHTIRTGKLGDAVAGGRADVVVVVRSNLFARFPGTLVYAVPSKGQGAAAAPNFAEPELPVFRGLLAPDAAYFGFAFTAQAAQAEPGRYLAFQEPATSPSFGLDVASTVSTFPAKASELAWTNVPLTGDFVQARRIAGGQAFTDNGAIWGADAADQAASTYQQPVRAAIHFRDLLGAP